MIIFYKRYSFEEDWKEVGTLDNSGKYTGDKKTKETIDQMVETYKLDLTKKEDQSGLRSLMSGTYIEALEVD